MRVVLRDERGTRVLYETDLPDDVVALTGVVYYGGDYFALHPRDGYVGGVSYRRTICTEIRDEEVCEWASFSSAPLPPTL